MSDWQAIGSAELSGRKHLLLYDANCSKTGEKFFVGRWDVLWNAWFSIPGAYRRKPTHWQHLPIPPEAE